MMLVDGCCKTDKASAHKNASAMRKLRDLKRRIVGTLTIFIRIGSGFHMFPNLRKFVAGKPFGSNEEVTAAVDGYFADLPDRTSGIESTYWRNVGQNVSKLREIA